MGFAPTWLRQVSPPASHDHFNHCWTIFKPIIRSLKCITVVSLRKLDNLMRNRCQQNVTDWSLTEGMQLPFYMPT